MYLPERALQSLLLIPFDLSHLKKSSSDMELLNVRLCVAGVISGSGGMRCWSIKVNKTLIAEMKHLSSVYNNYYSTCIIMQEDAKAAGISHFQQN